MTTMTAVRVYSSYIPTELTEASLHYGDALRKGAIIADARVNDKTFVRVIRYQNPDADGFGWMLIDQGPTEPRGWITFATQHEALEEFANLTYRHEVEHKNEGFQYKYVPLTEGMDPMHGVLGNAEKYITAWRADDTPDIQSWILSKLEWEFDSYDVEAMADSITDEINAILPAGYELRGNSFFANSDLVSEKSLTIIDDAVEEIEFERFAEAYHYANM